jgi:hypothetical protein
MMREPAEHLSEQQIEQYRARTLAASAFIHVSRHLAVCDVCHEKFLELAPAPLQLDPLTLDVEGLPAAPFHLTYDEHLAPYVDGRSNAIDSEIVESHVALCTDCASQLRELFAVKEELANRVEPQLPTLKDRPPPAPAVAPGILSARTRGTPARRIPLALFACVAALMLISAAFILWRARPAPAPRVGSPPDDGARSVPASPTPTGQSVFSAAKPGQSPTSPVAGTPQLLVSLNDGGRTITLDRQQHLGGWSELPTQYQRLVTDALLGQRIETPPEIAALTGHAGRLRGSVESGERFTLLNPAGTMTRTGQPMLNWQPLAGATGYTVKIYDAALNLVAVSPLLKQTTWRPNTPLGTDVNYSWQVTAEKDDGPVLAPQPPEPRALFRVLSPRRQAELTSAEIVAGDSNLLRGLVYARFGLLDEAESEWQKLRAANPNAKVPAELLHQLQVKRARR